MVEQKEPISHPMSKLEIEERANADWLKGYADRAKKSQEIRIAAGREELMHPRPFLQKLIDGARVFVGDFVNNVLHRR